ncbi:MAG: dTMP kinase [Oligoflexia bacterium]
MSSKKHRGKFITFEGTEGAGKSTLIAELRAQLETQGIKAVPTREPGGVAVAEKIRDIILHNEMSPWTELFLYEAARAEHLAEVILPALARGDWVLCDRFTDSTLAYQGHARGLPWKAISVLNQMATGGLEPDHVVWLDIDPALGLSVASDPNKFEAAGVKFQKKVRAGFLKAMKQDARRRPKKWLRVAARSALPAEMAAVVLQKIQAKKTRGRS